MYLSSVELFDEVADGYLSRCDKNTCKAIIKSATPELIKCIADICHKILKKKVNLSAKEKKKLLKYKSELIKVANKKSTLKSKKTLIQKGGFLSAILAPSLTGVIAPLAKTLFGLGKNGTN